MINRFQNGCRKAEPGPERHARRKCVTWVVSLYKMTNIIQQSREAQVALGEGREEAGTDGRRHRHARAWELCLDEGGENCLFSECPGTARHLSPAEGASRGSHTGLSFLPQASSSLSRTARPNVSDRCSFRMRASFLSFQSPAHLSPFLLAPDPSLSWSPGPPASR